MGTLRRQQRLCLRPPDRRAGPQRRDARDDRARPAQTPRAGGRSAQRDRGARRWTGAVGDPVRRTVRRRAGPDRGDARSDRVRPARHRPLQPAVVPRSGTPNLFRTFDQAIEACASQIGPPRAFYTTADTVADIEAIRQAGAMKSSFSTARRMARRWPRSTPAVPEPRRSAGARLGRARPMAPTR